MSNPQKAFLPSALVDILEQKQIELWDKYKTVLATLHVNIEASNILFINEEARTKFLDLLKEWDEFLTSNEREFRLVPEIERTHRANLQDLLSEIFSNLRTFFPDDKKPINLPTEEKASLHNIINMWEKRLNQTKGPTNS